MCVELLLIVTALLKATSREMARNVRSYLARVKIAILRSFDELRTNGARGKSVRAEPVEACERQNLNP